MTPEIAIIKEYPKRAGMILRRYAERLEFLCVICDKTKKSPLQAETTEGPACNGCYGQKVAEWAHYRELHDPTIHP